MSEFYVGQKVACINATPPLGARPNIALIEGQIYIIRWIGAYDWLLQTLGVWQAGVGVMLEGVNRITRNATDIPFSAGRFRPLESQAISIFRKIALDVTEGRKIDLSDPVPVHTFESADEKASAPGGLR